MRRRRRFTPPPEFARTWGQLPAWKQRSLRSAEYRRRATARGRCIRCGCKRDRDGAYCSTCLTIHNSTSNVGWQRRRALARALADGALIYD